MSEKSRAKDRERKAAEAEYLRLRNGNRQTKRLTYNTPISALVFCGDGGKVICSGGGWTPVQTFYQCLLSTKSQREFSDCGLERMLDLEYTQTDKKELRDYPNLKCWTATTKINDFNPCFVEVIQ